MRRTVLAIALMFVGLVVAAPAGAYFTTVLPAPNEPDLLGPSQNNGQEGILDYLYGMSNLTRVDDALDQDWTGAQGSVTGKVMFFERNEPGAAYDFGYLTNDADYQYLFTATGAGYNVQGDATFSVRDGFRFWLRPDQPDRWSSRQSENPNALDHMVTFNVTGGEHAGAHVIAWESGNPGDRDFNDLVIEVTGVDPVPEPASLALFGGGLLLLGGLMFLRRRSPARA